MKKILFLLLIATIGFTSCTNDEIEIGYNTTFKVNPSTVIAPFTFDYKAGELESFDANYKLRVRLLIYNKDGILVQEATDYFSNYASLMNTTLSLSPGEYIAIATSDIVKMSNDKITLEYWTLHNHKNLSTTEIKDEGYVGGKGRILGISKKKFNIKGLNDNIKIDIQPAGAVVYIMHRNIHYFSDVEYYTLCSTKNDKGLIFDENGDYSTIEDNKGNIYSWYFSHLAVDEYPNYDHIYSIQYALPTRNFNLKFFAETYDNNDIAISPDITINPRAGEQYLFVIDMSTLEYSYGIVNDSYNAPVLNGNCCKANLLQGNSNSNIIKLKYINQ